MTKRWPCMVVAMLCSLLAATSALAEEPKGFLEWTWGTTHDAIAQDQSWCQHREKFLEGPETITCHLYFVEDIPIAPLILDFRPSDTLSGYSMGVEPAAFTKMRDAVVAKFGPPTSTKIIQYVTPSGGRVPGERLEWLWPSGTYAMLAEFPTVRQVLLRVSTGALTESQKKKEEEKTQERKKGF